MFPSLNADEQDEQTVASRARLRSIVSLVGLVLGVVLCEGIRLIVDSRHLGLGLIGVCVLALAWIAALVIRTLRRI